jgi:hypothetical protein
VPRGTAQHAADAILAAIADARGEDGVHDAGEGGRPGPEQLRRQNLLQKQLTALASELSGRPVRRDLAMTGEITLRGRVLPIGGVKEKVLAAYRAGITTIILPAWNRKDMEDIPANVQKSIKFHFVEDMLEVLKLALEVNKGKKKG